MFFRSKPVGSYRYLQIVHSVREGKKVRQQVIATLGRLDLLEASGQLERLMRSGLRHCESFAVIALEGSDPPVGYIIAVRMPRQKEVNLSVLRSRKQWLEIVPERNNAKDPAPLK